MKYSPVATKVTPLSIRAAILAVMLVSFQSPVLAEDSTDVQLYSMFYTGLTFLEKSNTYICPYECLQ